MTSRSIRLFSILLASLAAPAALVMPAALAASGSAPDPARYDASIERLSAAHDVPERLIRRVIMRESRYAPHLTNHGHYGLMQIKLQTAQGMGYRGGASGLLDGETNLTYAVPYLANAYLAADRNEDRAVQLYAGGYYYVAKSKGLLSKLRTARSEPVTPEPVAAYAAPPRPSEPASPFAAMFGQAPAPQIVAADVQQADLGEADFPADDGELLIVQNPPLPPRRPASL